MPRTHIIDLESKTETLTDLDAPKLMPIIGGDLGKAYRDLFGGVGTGTKQYTDKAVADTNKQNTDKAVSDPGGNHSEVYQDGGEIPFPRP